MVCLEAETPGMTECGPDYCLFGSDNKCVKFSNTKIGKNQITQKCISPDDSGQTSISECADNYCKI